MTDADARIRLTTVRCLDEGDGPGRSAGRAADPATSPGDLPGHPAAAGVPQLTRRELDVLRLVAVGLSNADIARRLFISVGTVRKHLEHVFDRTGVRTRAKAVALALPHLVLDSANSGMANLRGSRV